MEKIGIDVHKVATQVCILTDTGEFKERRIRTERDVLTQLFGARPRARVLLEAATESEWVARHLESLGHEVIVADPNFSPMYASRRRKVKTDKRDARALCEACHLGAYRAAPSFAKRVRSLALGEELAQALQPLLKTHEHVCKQIDALDLHVEGAVTLDERAQRLTTVPSVGPVTALTFVAVIDDIGRFASADKLSSYLGLVPREYSSGEKQQRGHITKAGNRRLRSLLVECAWGILRRRNPETEALAQWATRIAERRGKRIAAVALARKLVTILFSMMQHKRAFEPQRLHPHVVSAAA